MTPLEKIWRDLIDRENWPPPPAESELMPITRADLDAMMLRPEDLAALASWPSDLAPVVPGAKAVGRRR